MEVWHIIPWSVVCQYTQIADDFARWPRGIEGTVATVASYQYYPASGRGKHYWVAILLHFLLIEVAAYSADI